MAFLAVIAMTGPALAELVFPSFTQRTGPFATSGTPFNDGYADYFTLLNERDGGIGGVKAKVLECETAYDTAKGVACYASTKGRGALVYQPLSTPVAYDLIPKLAADGIPLHTMGYGRTSGANGRVFSHVFTYPANHWDGASGIVNHLIETSGGSIKGKRLALLYLDTAYGKEPIPVLEELSEKHGFKLMLLPVDPPGTEQKSQWRKIKRKKADFVAMWGWGEMNPTAIRSAADAGFPMENFIGNWWSGAEKDVLPVGRDAHGYKAVVFHNAGRDYPVYRDLKRYVYDAGKAAGAGDQAGTVLYDRGLYAAMLAAEAARTAQGISGRKQITASDMRDGMEALEITEARMAELGMANFGPAFKVTCGNHGGPGLVGVQQWDANSNAWKLISDFKPTDSALIGALIEEDSTDYAAENGIAERC